MDKIVWQLDANASKVFTEMDKAIAAGRRFSVEMEKAGDKVDASHEKILRSSHRVSKQITNVSKDLLTGASAGDVFADSLEGIARSLNISLAALAALGVSAVIGQYIYKTIEEFNALQKSLTDLHAEASKSGDWKTVSQLEEVAKKADEAVKKLQERISARDKGGPSGFGQQLKDAVVDAWTAVTRPGGSAKGDKDDIGSVYADKDKLSADIISKRQQQSGLKEAALAGAPDSAIKAAQVLITLQEKAGKSLDEAAQNFREASIALQEIVKASNTKKAERAGMTLKELAGMEPDVVNNSVSYERWKASQDAKRAMGLDAQGEAARQNFDPAGAHSLFNQAGEAKEGIQNLKPSEKMSADFKGALSVTEAELHAIAENTAKQFVNK